MDDLGIAIGLFAVIFTVNTLGIAIMLMSIRDRLQDIAQAIRLFW